MPIITIRDHLWRVTEFPVRLLRLRLPLAGKVFLVCTGLALFVSLAGSIVLYRGASYSLRQDVRSKLKAIARTGALGIDPELLRQIRTRADESSQAYRKLQATLRAIQNANPEIRRVYTMRKTDRENVWQFVVDTGSGPGPEKHVGDEMEVSRHPEMQAAFFGPTAEENPAADRSGAWLAGCAPIRDRAGQAEAIVGLDMSVEQLRPGESALRRAALNNILVALLLANVLSLLLTRALLRPVHVFTQASQRIRSGDLDFEIPLPSSDEIGKFTGAFNHMIAGLKESRERLMEQTTRDFLTGVFNHRYFQERLGSEIERAERFDHNLCLLILDLDRFKLMNDALGHPVGDSILRQLGTVIRENIRKIDVAARYGGDEFAVILPETDENAGVVVAEHIRAEVEARSFYAVPIEEMLAEDFVADGGQVVRLTVTIGLASYPKHHRTRDGLLMAADLALCRAKHVARNSVCTYDATIGGEEHVDPHQLYQMLRDPNAAAIQSLAAAVDAKDRYTHGHSERVTAYALEIGEALQMSSEMRDALKVAGLLHDLGKIGVPDSILNKPGSLTQEEREALQRHPSIGGDILHQSPQLDLIIPAVLFHHERWDGAGYPDGLAGESIPLVARILAIADAFDAMTSDRPYRSAMSVDEGLLELQANAGKQFDPALVDAFIRQMSSVAQKRAA